MTIVEPEDPSVCVKCQYGSVRACPRRQEAMRRGHLSSDWCERKQTLSWGDRPEKIDVETKYDFSLRKCRRTLGTASYEKVIVYIGTIYAGSSSRRKFVRKLIEIELHETLHSVLDKLNIGWWRKEKRIEKVTKLVYGALSTYIYEDSDMWVETVPANKQGRHFRRQGPLAQSPIIKRNHKNVDEKRHISCSAPREYVADDGGGST